MMDVTEILAELHPVSVRWVLAREHREEACRVPATWWQQFKAEYFSEAMLRAWPIRYRVHGYHKILRMCPHATEQWDCKKMKHVRFLLYGNDSVSEQSRRR